MSEKSWLKKIWRHPFGSLETGDYAGIEHLLDRDFYNPETRPSTKDLQDLYITLQLSADHKQHALQAVQYSRHIPINDVDVGFLDEQRRMEIYFDLLKVHQYIESICFAVDSANRKLLMLDVAKMSKKLEENQQEAITNGVKDVRGVDDAMHNYCIQMLEKNKALDKRLEGRRSHTAPSAVDNALDDAILDFDELQLHPDDFLTQCHKIIIVHTLMNSLFHVVSFLTSLAKRIHPPEGGDPDRAFQAHPSTFKDRLKILPRAWRVWKEMRVFKIKGMKAMKLIQKYRRNYLD